MMEQKNLYLEHAPELLRRAVIFPDGHYVRLDDMLFQRHGLGPRYCQVLTDYYRQQHNLSYAYLDRPGTTYDLITDLDTPQDCGSFEDLIGDGGMLKQLMEVFVRRGHHQPTPQQIALALIRVRTENIQEDDELGLYRVVKWAPIYERRANWIASHRLIAFAKSEINWIALGL